MTSALKRRAGPAHVALLVATALGTDQHRESLPGHAVQRLGPRIAVFAITGLSVSEQQAALRQHLGHLLRDMLAGRLAGVVWLREDVVIDDYHLEQRLSEAWISQDMVTLQTPEHGVLLWAASARGLQQLKARLDSDAWAGLGIAAAGPFPAGVRGWLLAQGLSDGPYPIAISLAPLPLRQGDASVATPIRAWSPGSTPPLLIACATREGPERFETHTPTGRSLARLRAAGFQVRVEVTPHNRAALAKTYNAAIQAELADHIALFVHDDVWLDDFYLPHHLQTALTRYDVVGVAGSRNRIPGQPAWCFPSRLGDWDNADNLLGVVAHHLVARPSQPAVEVCRYGPVSGPARLLDGLMIAARVSTLLAAGVRFDERFPFHFYDLDFCRSAETHGLRLGTWPLGVTHHSTGDGFGSRSWLACWGRYVGKWGH